MNKMLIMITAILTLIVLTGCSKQETMSNKEVSSELQSSQEAQIVYLGLDREGYLPREITVKAGIPVTLKNDGTLGGCGLYPVQPELGLNANFAQDSEYTFTPTKKGKYAFTCSMGMFKGRMNVV